jgi:hypothetical protein
MRSSMLGSNLYIPTFSTRNGDAAVFATGRSNNDITQGCQMVYFQNKIFNLGQLWRALKWNILDYFMTICNISRCYGIPSYFMVIWNIFIKTLGIFYGYLVKSW